MIIDVTGVKLMRGNQGEIAREMGWIPMWSVAVMNVIICCAASKVTMQKIVEIAWMISARGLFVLRVGEGTI